MGRSSAATRAGQDRCDDASDKRGGPRAKRIDGIGRTERQSGGLVRARRFDADG